jgi:tetratricopeptide (TPR) repeat protein
MPVPQLAEALYEAHQQRLTGWLKVIAEGRHSELLLDEGNLVGAEIRTGYRSLVQSLLLRGLIDPPMLDSLWADGRGAGPAAVEALGVEWTRACEIQMLAQIELLSAKATSVQFEAGRVSSAFSPIPGERAVRAAWLPNGEIDGEGGMFRCVDLERCERWLLSEDERQFVRGFESFRPLSGATPAQRALLELLSREGTFERVDKSAPAQDSDEISWADLLDDKEEDVADDPSDPQEAARLRRQRLLRRAMENMGGFGARTGEASSAEVISPPIETAPAQTPASAQTAPSSDEMALVAALEKKFYEIERGSDHFVVLGVGRKASADEIKSAFVELAKVFHPDRLPESLRYLSAKMKATFEAVRVAYETLQNESRREAYEATMRAESPPQKDDKPAEQASAAFRRGDLLLRKKDYSAAEREYHSAYLIDPNAAYLAAEAWAIYLDPGRRDQAPRAKQMMVDAAKKDPECDRAHYQLGVIARVEGDMDRAEKHFREAVRLNPKHPEANQELRLIQMRRKKGVIR